MTLFPLFFAHTAHLYTTEYDQLVLKTRHQFYLRHSSFQAKCLNKAGITLFLTAHAKHNC